MAEQQRVLIVHADGREYNVSLADFTSPRVSVDKQTYADQGFRIVSYADGTPYDGLKTKREIDKAAEARAAAREQRAAAKPADGDKG